MFGGGGGARGGPSRGHRGWRGSPFGNGGGGGGGGRHPGRGRGFHSGGGDGFGGGRGFRGRGRGGGSGFSSGGWDQRPFESDGLNSGSWGGNSGFPRGGRGFNRGSGAFGGGSVVPGSGFSFNQGQNQYQEYDATLVGQGGVGGGGAFDGDGEYFDQEDPFAAAEDGFGDPGLLAGGQDPPQLLDHHGEKGVQAKGPQVQDAPGMEQEGLQDAATSKCDPCNVTIIGAEAYMYHVQSEEHLAKMAMAAAAAAVAAAASSSSSSTPATAGSVLGVSGGYGDMMAQQSGGLRSGGFQAGPVAGQQSLLASGSSSGGFGDEDQRRGLKREASQMGGDLASSSSSSGAGLQEGHPAAKVPNNFTGVSTSSSLSLFDEPSFDDSLVLLDWYDSDLNLILNEVDFCSARAVSTDGFGYIWAGARATYGAVSGKTCFEVRIDADQDASHLENEVSPNVLRCGWSVTSSSLQLGEEQLSFGYGGTAKKSENCKFVDYGRTFGVGDVIGCYLDMTCDPHTISYTLNGRDLGVAFRIRRSELQGQALFPHVLTKNQDFTVNFGQMPAPLMPLLPNYTPIGQMEIEDGLMRGPAAPSTRADCEVYMMVGLPGAGKTFWSEKYARDHPEKRFNILGTNNLLNRMKVNGLPRIRNYSGRWEILIKKCTECFDSLLKIASKRRRNYILDQTNVFPTARSRKIKDFEGMKCCAVVVVPSDVEFARRVRLRSMEEGKEIPEEAVISMKANFVLPELTEYFDNVYYVELGPLQAEELIKKYNDESLAKGYAMSSGVKAFLNKNMRRRSELKAFQPIGEMFPASGRGLEEVSEGLVERGTFDDVEHKGYQAGPLMPSASVTKTPSAHLVAGFSRNMANKVETVKDEFGRDIPVGRMKSPDRPSRRSGGAFGAFGGNLGPSDRDSSRNDDQRWRRNDSRDKETRWGSPRGQSDQSRFSGGAKEEDGSHTGPALLAVAAAATSSVPYSQPQQGRQFQQPQVQRQSRFSPGEQSLPDKSGRQMRPYSQDFPNQSAGQFLSQSQQEPQTQRAPSAALGSSARQEGTPNFSTGMTTSGFGAYEGQGGYTSGLASTGRNQQGSYRADTSSVQPNNSRWQGPRGHQEEARNASGELQQEAASGERRQNSSGYQVFSTTVSGQGIGAEGRQLPQQYDEMKSQPQPGPARNSASGAAAAASNPVIPQYSTGGRWENPAGGSLPTGSSTYQQQSSPQLNRQQHQAQLQPQNPYQAQPQSQYQAKPQNMYQAQPQSQQQQPQVQYQAKPQNMYQAESQNQDQAKPQGQQQQHQAQPQSQYQPQNQYQGKPQNMYQTQSQNQYQPKPMSQQQQPQGQFQAQPQNQYQPKSLQQQPQSQYQAKPQYPYQAQPQSQQQQQPQSQYQAQSQSQQQQPQSQYQAKPQSQQQQQPQSQYQSQSQNRYQPKPQSQQQQPQSQYQQQQQQPQQQNQNQAANQERDWQQGDSVDQGEEWDQEQPQSQHPQRQQQQEQPWRGRDSEMSGGPGQYGRGGGGQNFRGRRGDARNTGQGRYHDQDQPGHDNGEGPNAYQQEQQQQQDRWHGPPMRGMTGFRGRGGRGGGHETSSQFGGHQDYQQRWGDEGEERQGGGGPSNDFGWRGGGFGGGGRGRGRGRGHQGHGYARGGGGGQIEAGQQGSYSEDGQQGNVGWGGDGAFFGRGRASDNGKRNQQQWPQQGFQQGFQQGSRGGGNRSDNTRGQSNPQQFRAPQPPSDERPAAQSYRSNGPGGGSAGNSSASSSSAPPGQGALGAGQGGSGQRQQAGGTPDFAALLQYLQNYQKQVSGGGGGGGNGGAGAGGGGGRATMNN